MRSKHFKSISYSLIAVLSLSMIGCRDSVLESEISNNLEVVNVESSIIDEFKNIYAINYTFPAGEKTIAAIVEFDKEIESNSLELDSFDVFKRTVKNIYTNTEADISYTGGTNSGRFVVLELDYSDINGRTSLYHLSPSNNQLGSDGPAILETYISICQSKDINTVDGDIYKGDYTNSNYISIDEDNVKNSIVDLFVQRSFVDTNTNEYVQYNMYVPSEYSEEKYYPIMFYFEDAGINGNEISMTLKQGYGATIWASDSEININESIVVAIQCVASPANQTILDLLLSLTDEYSIDMNRIYLTGGSGGGSTCIELLEAYPNFFAGALLVATQIKKDDYDYALEKETLAKENIWYIISDDDTTAGVYGPQMVEALKGAVTIVDQKWTLEPVLEEYDTSFDIFYDKFDYELAAQNQIEIAVKEESNFLFTVFEEGTLTSTDPFIENGNAHNWTWQRAYNILEVRNWIYSKQANDEQGEYVLCDDIITINIDENGIGKFIDNGEYDYKNLLEDSQWDRYSTMNFVSLSGINDITPAGEKTIAAVIEFETEINNESVLYEYDVITGEEIGDNKFAVDKRTITKVYVNDKPEINADKNVTSGKYVIIELSTLDRNGRSLLFHLSPSKSQIGGNGAVTVDVKLSILQSGDIEDVNGRIYYGDETGSRYVTIDNGEVVNTVIDSFEQFSYIDEETGVYIQYNLYIPDRYENVEYPLVSYFHDNGVFSNNILATLRSGYGATIWATEEEQLKTEGNFVFAPQSVSGFNTDEKIIALHNLIENITDEYNIDRNRLYITGGSGGGSTCMNLMKKYPNIYAAALLIATQPKDETGEFLEEMTLSNENIWYIVSEDDETAANGSLAFIDKLIENEEINANILADTWYLEPTADIPETLARNGAKTAAESDWVKDMDIYYDRFDYELAAKEQIMRAEEIGSSFLYTRFAEGTLTSTDPFMENGNAHNWTWQRAYNISAVREWLFKQSLE